MVRVLIADDHDIVRRGLISALSSEPDIEVVGQAADGREAIDKAVELEPDVVIMDILMPNLGGLEATSALAHRLPQTRVLILTVSDSEENLFHAVKFGARGYLLKSATIDDIIAAVRQVAEGEAILSPYIAGKLLDELCHEPFTSASLSLRETEVLKLVGEGMTNHEIADRLIIAESTVKTYLQRVLEKLHLENRAQAIGYAVSHGLIEKQPWE
jgi:DNA-binding NarL/FixJ family response regulator